MRTVALVIMMPMPANTVIVDGSATSFAGVRSDDLTAALTGEWAAPVEATGWLSRDNQVSYVWSSVGRILHEDLRLNLFGQLLRPRPRHCDARRMRVP